MDIEDIKKRNLYYENLIKKAKVEKKREVLREFQQWYNKLQPVQEILDCDIENFLR